MTNQSQNKRRSIKLMTAEEFYEQHWDNVQNRVINSFCPLKKALGTTSLAQFFKFIKAHDDLATEWLELKVFIEDNIAFEMLDAYHSQAPNDQWAEKKILMRVQALEKIKNNINVPKVKEDKHKIEISYDED